MLMKNGIMYSDDEYRNYGIHCRVLHYNENRLKKIWDIKRVYLE